MPAFTAIGAYVAGTIFGLVGTAAIVVGSIVAFGAAYITSRIINGNPNKGGNASSASQGGRIQVPPATNNKIPVLYGSAYVNGIITDARLISTDQKTNNTMFYCIVLSETCNDAGAAYDVNNIYWNDLRLTQVDSTTNAHKIKDGRKNVDNPDTSIEDFVDDNFVVDDKSLVEVRIYAGSSAANKQIFPSQASANTQAAYDFWGNNDNSWTSGFAMSGLVFAIVKITYNGEKGFTALPNMTFDISNTIRNPSDVWYDYMTGVRYGAGINGNYIDSTAQTTWRDFCNEDINYTDRDGVTTQSTERYTINGLIDTTRSVKENIDIILQNGGAWMSYDVSTGLWSPVIKKAITAGDPTVSSTHFTGSRTGTQLTVTAFPEGRIEAGQELYDTAGTLIGTITSQLAPTSSETTGQKGRYTTSSSGSGTTTFYTTAPNLLTFSDDNIISGISISSTRLDDLYNSVEAEFYDQYNKDQKAYARNEINFAERNPNEPDNQLRMSLDLCNNSMQADILGQMELRQSRDDLVIDFTSNHYGIQTQAGDIVNVYSELYDWNPKLFRVMRVKEQETEDGGLVAQIQAMEYNGDVYTIEPITEFTTEENIGIGVYGASPNLPPPPDVIIAAIDADVAIPNFQLQVTIPTTGGPYDEIELYYTEGWDEMPISGTIVPGTGINGAAVGQGLLTVTSTPQGHINAGDRIDRLAPLTDITIVSQITNTVSPKTYSSGGVPVSVNPATTTSRLITLTDVTGLLIGNTLTGTGIPNGTFILEINPAGSPANTVRIEDAVTAQAAGTYTVTGGLGTYIVDTSTTTTLTAINLYDFPEADNYKLLKKITPEGNNPTFTNGEVIIDIITTVPANSATYRRWYIKARMGIKKRFGRFSNPGNTDYNSGRFPYKPSPTGGGSLNDLTDVSITNAEEGDFLWYNGIEWINTNEPTVDTFDRTLRLTKRYSSTVANFETDPALRLNGRVSDAVNDNTDDAGPALRFERSSGAEYAKTFVSGGAIGAFTVTLNNVTGVLVGNKVTGTGLPSGNGALITVIAGNQLTLDTAFTVQAAGTYNIGAPVGFGQLAFDYFGTTDVHRFRVVTSTDNFLESPVDVYPGTTVLIDSTKNYTNINDDVLYVDAVNNRVGINDTSPSYELHVNSAESGPNDNVQFALSNSERTFILSNDASGSNLLSFNYGADRLQFDLTNQWFNTGKLGVNNSSPAYNLDVTGDARVTLDAVINGDLYVNGTTSAGNVADIVTSNINGAIFNTNATTLDIGGVASTLNIGATSGTITIGNPTVRGTQTTQNLYNTVATTLNIGGASTATNIGSIVSGTTTIGYDLFVNRSANIETSLTVPSISTLTGDDLSITAFSGREVTISTTASNDPVTIVRNIATTNDSIRTLTLRANSTGTPVVDFGNFLEFETETTPGTFVRSGSINNKSTGDNAGVLDEFKMSFGVMSAGANTERMVLDNLGNLQIDGDLTVSGNNIKSSSATAITLSGANVAVAGDLTVTGNDIKSSSATAITLSGADVTVAGGLNVDSGTLFVDATNNRVGINNLTPTEALDVLGNVTVSNDLYAAQIDSPNINAGQVNMYFGFPTDPKLQINLDRETITGNTLQVLHAYDRLTYRSIKFTMSMTKGTDYHCLEGMVIHDGTTAYITVYNEIFTNASLVTLSADILDTPPNYALRILVTPTTTGNLKILSKLEAFELF
jgi:hypothetical protein